MRVGSIGLGGRTLCLLLLDRPVMLLENVLFEPRVELTYSPLNPFSYRNEWSWRHIQFVVPYVKDVVETAGS
jgi:predicted metalloenzyme YecM